MTKKLLIAIFCIILVVLNISYTIYQLKCPRIIQAPLDIPVMEKIALCESNGQQYAKDGQVLIKINTNNTYDTGVYQINSVWNTTATKLGYDLTREKDNKAFALWLFKNKGTANWSSSAKCWDK